MLLVERLSKSFGAVNALHAASFEIARGEFVAVVGPSGCGKTTLLRCIAGFEQPTSGAIAFDGRDITALPPQLRRIGMVFQHYALFPHMTVRENIAFGLQAQKRSAADIVAGVARAAATVRLTDKLDVKVPYLSGGEQQRVALARAIAPEPTMLLLDEPLSNLDPVLRDELRTELVRVQRDTGLTTIHVTHDQGEALALADRIIAMRSGLIEQFASPRDIYFHPASAFVASFMGSATLYTGTIEDVRVGKSTPVMASDTSLLSYRFETTEGRRVRLSPGVTFLCDATAESLKQLPSGAQVRVAIKPEGIRIAGSGVPAVVQSCVFSGAQTEYILKADEMLFHARKRSTHRSAHEPGDRVFMHFEPSLCTVFPA